MTRQRVAAPARVLRIVAGLLFLLDLAGPLSLVSLIVNGVQAHGRSSSMTDPSASLSVGDGAARDLGPASPGTSVQVGAGRCRSVQVQGEVHHVVDHAASGLWLLDSLPVLLATAVTSIVAALLSRLLADTELGRPFSARSVRRLRWVAGTTAVTGLVPLLRAVGDHLIATAVQTDAAPGAFVLWDPVDTTTPWLLVAGLV